MDEGFGVRGSGFEIGDWGVGKVEKDSRGAPMPLPSEFGTHRTVKARLWPWHPSKRPSHLSKLFPARSEAAWRLGPDAPAPCGVGLYGLDLILILFIIC